MPRRKPEGEQVTADQSERKIPSKAERKGKRGHDEHGNVRPADGRWGLHEPEEESEVCVNETAPPAKRARARRSGRPTERPPGRCCASARRGPPTDDEESR